MGQAEVLTFFQNNKRRWITNSELKKKFSEQGLSVTLMKLRHWKLLEYKEYKQRFPSNNNYRISFTYRYKPNVISK